LSFSAVPGVSILKYDTLVKSFAILANKDTGNVTPLKGASCIMIGISMALARASKC